MPRLLSLLVNLSEKGELTFEIFRSLTRQSIIVLADSVVFKTVGKKSILPEDAYSKERYLYI